MRICSVLLAVPLLLACNDKALLDPEGDEEPEVPLEATVQATTSNSFNPPTVTIQAGGEVTFAFQATPHTVIFEGDVPDDIIQQSSNVNVKRTFPTPNTYLYTCGIHGSAMQGTVIVVPAAP